MILADIDGEILATKHSHIAFAISAEGGGLNLAGLGGRLASGGQWPNLILVKNQPPGSVVSRQVSGITYHALVVYQFRPNGWVNTPHYLRSALDSMQVPADAIVAIAQIGAIDLAGEKGGVNQKAIRYVMEISAKRLIVYMKPKTINRHG